MLCTLATPSSATSNHATLLSLKRAPILIKRPTWPVHQIASGSLHVTVEGSSGPGAYGSGGHFSSASAVITA